MSDDLPEGWTETTLGEVVDYGKTEKAEKHQISGDAWILELEDIEKDSSRLLQRLTFAERDSKSTKNRFKKGDVLYGKLRPYLNKVLVADQDGFCTTEIIPITPTERIFGRFLFYWLKGSDFLEYAKSVSHGLNMPRLGTKDGLAAPIILPPYPEQKRIVDKLDSLLARVDRCHEHLDRVPQLLKQFRQSVLAAATSGKLTEDWREENNHILPAWQNTTIGDVSELITKGASPNWQGIGYVDDSTQILFITSENVGNGKLLLETKKFVELAFNQKQKRSILKNGDVLTNIVGASIGRAAIFDLDSLANVNQAVCLIRVNKSLL